VWAWSAALACRWSIFCLGPSLVMAAPLAASPSHAGVADEMLAGTGCAPAYEALELCLADHDRSFAKCADATRTFRQCMDAFAEKKLELARQRNAHSNAQALAASATAGAGNAD
jgi:hypothetical protein